MGDIQKGVIRHAQADLAADPVASHNTKEPSLVGRLWEKRNEWAAQQPSLGGQLAAMFREGVKDVRQTFLESYFGKGEHAPEAGAPGNPTQIQVNDEQGNIHGYDYERFLAEASKRGTNHSEGLSR